MKKVLFVFVLFLAGIFTYGYGQDVRVNINNQDYSSQDCEYKINGICSSEDIGGVEIQGRVKWDLVTRGSYRWYSKGLYAVLTNYNQFTVTILFETYYNNRVHSIVLRANETKEVFDHQLEPGVQFNNPEPSYNTSFPIKGMIVRKLGQ